jgi:hypothetical protein
VIPEEIRRYAEDPNIAGGDPPPPLARVVTDGYVLWLGPVPSLTSVSHLRLAPEDVAEALARVRELVAERGHREATWWVGSSATPADLVDRLVAHGLRPDDRQGYEPHATAMATVTAPPPGPDGVIARPVETWEEYHESIGITGAGFGIPEHEMMEWRGVAEDRWQAEQAGQGPRTFMAWADGEPVAVGRMLLGPCAGFLIGGATLPAARGRGTYRALVGARWDHAVAAGTPALVTQAGARSRPILERLGFEAVAEIEILLDPVTT